MDTALVTLDCIGMQCPAPILAISKAAKAARRPALLEVRADDSDFAGDVRAWCRSTGATLQSLEEIGGTFVARISLGEAASPQHRTPDRAGSDGADLARTTPSLPPRTMAGSAMPAMTPSVPQTEHREPDRRTRPYPTQPASNQPQASQTGQPPVGRLELDCRGMRCPAPILEVTRASRNLPGPTVLTIRADDPDFPPDLTAWCRATGAELFGIDEAAGVYTGQVGVNGARPPNNAMQTGSMDLRGQAAEIALLQLGQRVMGGTAVQFVADPGPLERHLKAWAQVVGAAVEVRREGALLRGHVQLDTRDMSVLRSLPPDHAPHAPQAAHNAQTAARQAAPAAEPARQANRAAFLLLHNDFEPLMAALMTANACAAQGMDVEIYFMFWGVNVLRAPRPKAPVGAPATPFMKKMMKWMMPAGPEAQQMSKMNMGGMGVEMMKFFIKKENVMTIRALLNSAVEADVKFVACSTTMAIMGIEKHDLLDLPNIRFGGVTGFASSARESAMSLVF